MTALHGAPRVTVLLVATAALSAGCTFSGLQFHNDNRLKIQSPKVRQLVTAPVRVSWEMTGFTASGLDGSSDKAHGAYGVFVDRAPMPLGKDLKWLLRNDDSCARDPRCPDAAFLKDRGIYVTTDTSLVLDTLPTAADGEGDEQHSVTVVLLDGTGHRIGESAWYRPFKSKRRSTT